MSVVLPGVSRPSKWQIEHTDILSSSRFKDPDKHVIDRLVTY